MDEDLAADEGDDELVDDSGSEASWDEDLARRRLTYILGIALLATLVIGLVWIVVTGLMARSQMNRVQGEIRQLRTALLSGDSKKAQALAGRIQQQAHRAHELTTGPAWWIASNVPVFGTPAQTSRTLAASVDAVSRHAIPTALQLQEVLLHERGRLRSGIDLAPLAAVGPKLAESAQATSKSVQSAANSDPSWLPNVASARRSVIRQLTKLDNDLTGAQRTVQVLLPMLGQHGPKRYFIGFLNEAESRPLGGIPGAFAVATADHGRISFDHFGSDSEMAGARADVNLGTDYAARYAQDDPTGVFQNSDIGPDFRDAAQIWAGMWQARTGEHVNGAIALDPTALSYVLKVTGPARLPDGTRVGADNVVALTQQMQYKLFPGNSQREKAERKNYLISIAKSVAEKLARGGDGRAFVKAFSRAAGERRLLVWSADPGAESRLRLAGWAGELGNPYGRPFSGFTVTNAAASKLDYYLDRSITYTRDDCSAGGTATATMRLTNDAPRSGLPPYVVIRADAAPRGARPGDNKVLVTYYASSEARITQVEVNGQPVPADILPEGNTLAVTIGVELPVGQPTTVKVTIAEPTAYGPVQVLDQPLVRPAHIDTRTSCG